MRIRGMVSRALPVAWRLRRITRAAKRLEKAVCQVYDRHRAEGIDHHQAVFLTVFVLETRGVNYKFGRLIEDILHDREAIRGQA